MRITVVYQYYQGTDTPGLSWTYEMTQALARQGHAVTVVSGETGYMHPERPRVPWYKRWLRRERDGLVDIVRVYTYSRLHRNYFSRLLSFISFSVNLPFGLLLSGKTDVLLASSPPIFPMLPTIVMCKLRRIPLVFEVRDLWPESAVQLGILRNRHLIKMMAWLEKLSYQHARRIVTLTHGIKEDIQSRGWPEQKVQVITCGVDPARIFPDPEAGARIRAQHGWEGRDVVLYLGAMGEANHLETVLDAASHCRNKNVLFVLVGDGMMRPHLQQQVEARALDNVKILPPVPKMLVNGYMSAADICLVNLKKIALFKGAIPTKLLEYMACGRPVLCGVQGEAADILEKAGAGWVFPPGDAPRLAQMVEDLLADSALRRRMGEAGITYIHRHFDIQHNSMLMARLLENVIAESPRQTS